MIQTNADVPEFSLVAKGREFLEKGNIPAAVECYGQAYDPDAVDEAEARSMLIEARATCLESIFWKRWRASKRRF